jgi:hypothetical protein
MITASKDARSPFNPMAFPIAAAAAAAGMLMHHAYFDRALDLGLRGELAEIRNEINNELEDAIKNDIKAMNEELSTGIKNQIKAINEELLLEIAVRLQEIEKNVWGRRKYQRDYGAAVRGFKVLRLL